MWYLRITLISRRLASCVHYEDANWQGEKKRKVVGGLTLRKSTFLSSFCSWYLSWRTMAKRSKVNLLSIFWARVKAVYLNFELVLKCARHVYRKAGRVSTLGSKLVLSSLIPGILSAACRARHSARFFGCRWQLLLGGPRFSTHWTPSSNICVSNSETSLRFGEFSSLAIALVPFPVFYACQQSNLTFIPTQEISLTLICNSNSTGWTFVLTYYDKAACPSQHRKCWL